MEMHLRPFLIYIFNIDWNQVWFTSLVLDRPLCVVNLVFKWYNNPHCVPQIGKQLDQTKHMNNILTPETLDWGMVKYIIILLSKTIESSVTESN